MSMSVTHILVFIISLTAPLVSAIGINYGQIGDNLPPPETVAQLVKSQNIPSVRIFNADPALIQAFGNQGISVAITMGNGVISSVASSQAAADSWISSNVMPFASTISLLIVGNEVIKFDRGVAPQLAPAMTNLFNSLNNMGAASIKVSTAHAMDVLDPGAAFPPSAGVFQSDIAASVMQPVLDFLSRSGSPFLLNAYPFFAYRDDKGANINLQYALLEQGAAGADDSNTGLHYSTLLDAQIDTVYSAMQKLNHGDVPIVVTETGWASAGDFGATVENAGTYNRNLVRLVSSGHGTPLKPSTPVQAFIFALFNENQKQSVTEQNFGVFRPDLSKVYDINF